MLTVVDAANLTRDFASHDFLRDRGEKRDAEDQRTLVELLVDQIEFADVIVLNKVTAAGPERLADARRIIRSLNPGARVIETDFCDVPLTRRLRHRPLRLREGPHPPALGPGAERLQGPRPRNRGIRHRIVRLARPPAIRCPPDPRRPRRRHAGRPPRQGLVLGRDRPQPHLRVQRRRRPDRHPAPRPLVGGDPTEGLADRSEAVARIHANWRAPFGDRRQELVFIGTGMDRAAITAALEACLVSRPRMPFAPGNNFHGKFAAARDAHTGKSRVSS